MSRAVQLLAVIMVALVAGSLTPRGRCAETADPTLDLLVQKGFITQQEAEKTKAEAAALRNNMAAMPPLEPRWLVNQAIKSVELFGDIRLRYEHRQVNTPADARLGLERWRYALRVGLRGEAMDSFYYGLRLDTAGNPRSSWITMGTSTSGNAYNGPYGKSTAGINVGQLYLGWKPQPWVDITVGKMPNPLFTSAMVWDPDLNPEGAAERFRYTVGEADLFLTFGQFLYQDYNPAYASGGLGFNTTFGQSGSSVYQLAFQAGLTYHITKHISVKAAATIYDYIGLGAPGGSVGLTDTAPYFNGPYVGEGQYCGGGGIPNGSSGFGTSSALAAIPSQGFPLNQVGLNQLLVLEIPLEINFKYSKFDARIFGDYAYNLDGEQRAQEAAQAYSYYLANTLGSTIQGFSPQKNDVHAYQVGFAIASTNSIGLVNGAMSRKHAWEFRSYWQHVEQYALDPNLMDSDFFEGRANLEGIFAAAAYGLSDNMIGTVRYGYANRINNKLGTGGSNQDVPQVNPIYRYNLLQVDLTFRF